MRQRYTRAHTHTHRNDLENIKHSEWNASKKRDDKPNIQMKTFEFDLEKCIHPWNDGIWIFMNADTHTDTPNRVEPQIDTPIFPFNAPPILFNLIKTNEWNSQKILSVR